MPGFAGAFALRRKHLHEMGGSLRDKEYDPEHEEYLQQKRFIQKNLHCDLRLFQDTIPPEGGKLEGLIILEALVDVNHQGVFLLMKGLPHLGDLRKKEAMRQSRSNVKFTVLTHAGMDQGEWLRVEGGDREIHQLELDIPEELPPPLIKSDGKLVYKLQAFLSTPEGRHICMGDTTVRWICPRIVTAEERGKQLRLEQTVESRRAWLVGPKKTGEMEWRTNKGAYLRGEKVVVELGGQTGEAEGLELDCQVELVQKVWYQVPQKTHLDSELKINSLVVVEGECDVEGEGEEKTQVWSGILRIPRGITPTFTQDFTNSVSYVLRFGVGLRGEGREGEGWVVGEVPLVVGTSLEVEEEKEEGEEEEDEEDGAVGPLSRCPSMGSLAGDWEGGGHHHHPGSRRGSEGEQDMRRRIRSMSVCGFPKHHPHHPLNVKRMDTLQSFACSTLSLIRPTGAGDRGLTLEDLPAAQSTLSPEDPAVASTLSSPGIPVAVVVTPEEPEAEAE